MGYFDTLIPSDTLTCNRALGLNRQITLEVKIQHDKPNILSEQDL
jgi:hypothetical protein